jgi:hypothetical protein
VNKKNFEKTHQSLSNAVKQESIATREGSMSSDSIITMFTARLLEFKAKINKKNFQLHGFEGEINCFESEEREKNKAKKSFIEITSL